MSFIKKNLPYLIITLGVLLRVVNWEAYPFGFDQVQILTQASAIKSGNFTFIGPKTGPADFYTGPLIYYLTSLVNLFLSFPYFIPITVGLIAALTGFIYWHLTSTYFSSLKFLLLCFWAFSPFLIDLDRRLWNPNLTFLASACVLLPLISLKPKQTLSLKSYFFVSIGCFLGYQAHFTGLLLPLLAVLLLIINKNFNLKWLAWIFTGSFLSFLPTLAFDFKNHWLNTRGLISLLKHENTVSTCSQSIQTLKSISISLENFAKTLTNHNYYSYLYLGIGLFTLSFIIGLKSPRHKLTTLFASFWLFSICWLFSFYCGPKPEYYFIIGLPATIVLLGQLFRLLSPLTFNLLVPILIIFMGVQALIATFPRFPLDFGAQYQMSQYLAKLSKEFPLQTVNYSMAFGDTFGLKYLNANLIPSTEGLKVTIINPVPPGLTVNERFGGIGVLLGK